jgi:hypothetical protein
VKAISLFDRSPENRPPEQAKQNELQKVAATPIDKRLSAATPEAEYQPDNHQDPKRYC